MLMGTFAAVRGLSLLSWHVFVERGEVFCKDVVSLSLLPEGD